MYKLAVWGKDDTLETPVTISQECFSEFLQLCFQYADLFSLNKAVWANCVCKDLQNELEPFLYKELQTSKWFGYDYSLAPPRGRRQIRVYLYRADRAAKEIILKHCSDIFLRNRHHEVFEDSLQTLEDLCFFSDGTLFVGTVSHEYMLNVFPPDKDFENVIKKLGNWNYIQESPFCVNK